MKLIKELDRRPVGENGNKVRFAEFECDICGEHVVVQKQNGIRYKSCGCVRYELSAKASTTHGDSNPKSVYKRLFATWSKMKDRCYRESNKDYKYYGAKGIEVDPLWINDYMEFKKWSLLNGYEPNKKLQIDRKDGNKNYCPDNCRWVDAKTNQRNRDCVLLNMEKANEIRILISKKISSREISEMYGVSVDTISDIRRGKTWKC